MKLVATLSLVALLFSGCARGMIAYTGPSGAIRLAPPVQGLRVEVFETGRMVIPGWSVYLGGEGSRLMDQPAYLIHHPQYGDVLFEAGHHSAISRDPSEHLGWIHTLGLMPMEQDPGQDARSQMKALGIDPDAVRDVIASHFHPEHVGAAEEYTNARIVADRREIDHGLSDPDYNYVRSEYDEVKRWYGLDFTGAPAFGPFEGVIDLVGDGSLLVLATPGHTPGHVSLLLNLPEGAVLLTGDMAWTEGNIQTRSIGLPFVSSDGPAARASLGRLVAFQRDNPEVLVVPGHDLNPLRRVERHDITLHPWHPADAHAVNRKPHTALGTRQTAAGRMNPHARIQQTQATRRRLASLGGGAV